MCMDVGDCTCIYLRKCKSCASSSSFFLSWEWWNGSHASHTRRFSSALRPQVPALSADHLRRKRPQSDVGATEKPEMTNIYKQINMYICGRCMFWQYTHTFSHIARIIRDHAVYDCDILFNHTSSLGFSRNDWEYSGQSIAIGNPYAASQYHTYTLLCTCTMGYMDIYIYMDHYGS